MKLARKEWRKCNLGWHRFKRDRKLTTGKTSSHAAWTYYFKREKCIYSEGIYQGTRKRKHSIKTRWKNRRFVHLSSSQFIHFVNQLIDFSILFWFIIWRFRTSFSHWTKKFSGKVCVNLLIRLYLSFCRALNWLSVSTILSTVPTAFVLPSRNTILVPKHCFKDIKSYSHLVEWTQDI